MNSSSTHGRTARIERAALAGGLVATLFVGGIAQAAPRAAKPAPARAAEALKGDPSAGGKTFAMRCSACHGPEGAGGSVAPNLTQVYGAHAASATYAKYSAALKASGVTWTASNLDSYLAAPARRVPGTAMMAAVPNAADRANLVAYLASLKSSARISRR